MFLLTVIPLVVEPVNKMWHAGNYMSFPARYAYMTAFFGLAMFGHILEQVYSEQAVCLRTKTRLYPAVVLCTAVVLCAAATLVLYRNFENVRAYTKTLWGGWAIVFYTAGSVPYFVRRLWSCSLFASKEKAVCKGRCHGSLHFTVV